MNIFATQTIMADGRTLREHTIDPSPDNWARFSEDSLDPQIPPQRVSGEEFLKDMAEINQEKLATPKREE